MLPSVISSEIQAGITSFLRTTFPPSTPAFAHTLDKFIATEGQVFKGPYYSLRLPFRPAPDGKLPFGAISFPFRPHLHQAHAFTRLCGDIPRSTLIATGTGSGKTECFLYPILDACAQHGGEPGIKAIVIYPMNALATDQAKRFARAIHADPALRGRIRAGLFIGGEGDDASVMSPEWLITDKESLRQNPPDILLTNYKMLDYLLLRPTEQLLWSGNAPTTLRYLVVDELHTFDGAQATDLACLVRRLKARLRTPAMHLCCVGTSATLGSPDSASPLVGYATRVFAEPFSDDCVIVEHLLSLQDFTADCFIAHHGIPRRRAPGTAATAEHTPQGYLAAEYAAWFDGVTPAPELSTLDGRVELGQCLRQHSFFRNLLTLAERSQRKVLSEEWMVHELAPLLGRDTEPAHVRRLLDGFISLCAHARYRDPKTGTVGPLLRVHAHLWIRELSRLVASVESDPSLGVFPSMAFSDDLAESTTVQHLPVIHCRECGAMGWGATQRANNEKLGPDLQEFYKAYFNQRPDLRFLFPVSDDGTAEGPAQREFTHRVCGRCLRVHGPESKVCKCHPDAKLVSVRLHDRTRRVNDQTEADCACPYCESRSGITILGSRSASLTSVALSQLFTSPFNSEKKSLAFSDNVQDASHRAGFFSARTYRINLRTAMAKVIYDAGAPLTLPALQQKFLATWRKALGDANFVGVFLAPSMEWLRDFEALRDKGELPAGSDLPELVARRLRWEMVAEVGYNSRIGRTLEKSGTAIAYVLPTAIAAAAKRLGRALREKAGGFAKVTESELIQLILSWIHRLRTEGGIFEPELELYVGRGGDTYLFNRQKHLPGFHSFGIAPVFFYQGTTSWPRFERVVASGTTPTWSQKRVNKVLAFPTPLPAEETGIAAEEMVVACRDEGLIEERIIQGNQLWGISPGQLLVTTAVRQLACRRCGHGISCAEEETATWTDGACLRPTCQGVYVVQPPTADYFGDLYRSGDIVRIRSAEHTGLLTRKDREQLENRFMAEGPSRRATDPNLLSSTPTLEMGVNIGDLASVVLCSVPPATANYVQRVGRAGRKEGAATSLTIAAAKSHDLYYFEQPEDMLAGEIRPPGTFLDAPAVLERQFTAYCLDRWSEQTAPRPVLPPKIATVLEAITKPEPDPAVFPYSFFGFIDAQLSPLLAGFLSLFSVEDLQLGSRTTLEMFARGDGVQGGVAHRILLRLTDLAKDRASLKDRIKRIGAALRKNREIVARDEACDQELHDLQQQRDGVHGMLEQINDKLTLNFLTDEGLLPNYAFPEEGVELRSIILKERAQPVEGGGKYQAETYEYIRPSSSAITELAPGNVFYVEGRRLIVDQVGLQVSPIEAWHFCDACNHMERVVEAAPSRTQCPACASPNWVDASLRRDLIRLRQVVSTSLDRNARSDDRKDDREREFFNRHESVVIPPEAERQAYQIRDAAVPFGFEFLGKLILRVVNLGQDTPETHAYRIGGKEVSSKGFALCPDCGKVQTKRSARGEEELRHDLSCRRVGRHDEPLRAVFLYRELQSEAIRVLLPATGDTAAREMDSFVAALHLGLRLFFRGSIDHLKGSLDEQPVRGSTQLRRRYLVLYDQVPGGTGYLKQLSQRPEVFLEVLRLALAHLEACSCQTKHDHDTDGCHRCILQARHNRDHATLSRQTAIRLLKGILEHASKLEAVPQLSDIDIHPLIESELEKRFLAALRAEPGAQLQEKIVRGKAGFLWRLGNVAWEVALQVPMPAGTTIAVSSRPDFIFYPVRPQNSRPIAVFLDGYEFHANEAAGRNRIDRDVSQRNALISSGQYWVWNFAWEDIDFRNDPAKIHATHFGQADTATRKTMAAVLLKGVDLDRVMDTAGACNWSLFIDYLQRPAYDYWVSYAFLAGVGLAERLQPAQLNSVAQVISDLSQHGYPVPAWPVQPPEAAQADGLGAVFSASQLAGVFAATMAGMKAHNPAAAYLLLHFDDDRALAEPDFAAHWRGFLGLMNRVQFLPWFHVVTTRLARNGAGGSICANYDQFIMEGRPKATAAPVSGEQAARLAECELAHPLVRPLLLAINANGLPWPVIGYELMPDGRTIATAELAWLDQQLALFTAEQTEESASFAAAGWHTTTIPVDDWPESSMHEFIKNKLATIIP